jgi:hypothetical protein
MRISLQRHWSPLQLHVLLIIQYNCEDIILSS